MAEDAEINTSALDKLIRSLKVVPIARVGILASSRQRSFGSNAAIGAKHEFGLEGMPTRSFLRIPITDNMQKYLDQAGGLSEPMIKEVMQEKSLLPVIKKLGILSEVIVQDAFNTGGFGKWRPSNMAHKKIQQTLVETKQLRESITSEVKT